MLFKSRSVTFMLNWKPCNINAKQAHEALVRNKSLKISHYSHILYLNQWANAWLINNTPPLCMSQEGLIYPP